MAFGGAGPLHGASVAAELGMTRVVVPAASGVLSALGMLVSERRRDLVESVLLAGDALRREAVAEAVERLAARGREELGEPDAEVRASYDLRYAGQAFELTIPGDPAPDPGDLRRAFDDAHEDRYGYSDADAELELVTIRVAVALPAVELPPEPSGGQPERGARRVVFAGERLEGAVSKGPPVGAIEGPAIVDLAEATLVVPPGWHCGTADDGTIEMTWTR